MGYSLHQWNFAHKCLDNHFPDFGGKKMLELGNQHIKKSVFETISIKERTAKAYFQRIGFKHTSFDINGQDGAKVVDLSKIDKKYVNNFSIITNMGTTEHVEPLKRQYECFNNIHNWCEKDGIMLHVVPEVGGFKNHCQLYYTMKFFEDLSDFNGYEILELEKFTKANGILIMACVKKTEDNKFYDCKNELLKSVKFVPYTKKTRKRYK
jgi:hypothetical protein